MLAGELLRQRGKWDRSTYARFGSPVERQLSRRSHKPQLRHRTIFDDLKDNGHTPLFAQPCGFRDDCIPVLTHNHEDLREIGAKVHAHRIGKNDGAGGGKIRAEIIKLINGIPGTWYLPHSAAASRGLHRLLDGLAGRPDPKLLG